MTDLFTHVALPFAIVCLAAWPLARRKSDTYRAPTSADVAVTVLAQVAARRAEDAYWRNLVAVVDAAAFERARDQIRALPEVGETA